MSDARPKVSVSILAYNPRLEPHNRQSLIGLCQTKCA
jgi:hypothetical protein